LPVGEDKRAFRFSSQAALQSFLETRCPHDDALFLGEHYFFILQNDELPSHDVGLQIKANRYRTLRNVKLSNSLQ
jgi:hypothetical protein